MNASSEPSLSFGGQDHENKDTRKVPCSNYHYLEKAFEIVSLNMSDMIEKYEISNELKEKFKAQFIEKYRYLINENITVKGFPWEIYKGLSSTTKEKEEKKEFLNTLLPKVGTEITNTTAKRKQYPSQYCRILQQRLKLQRQNLKRQQIQIHSCLQNNSEGISGWDSTEKMFKKGSSDINFFKMNVQSQIDNIKKAKESVSVIEEICANQDEFAFEPSKVPKSPLLPKARRRSPEPCTTTWYQFS